MRSCASLRNRNRKSRSQVSSSSTLCLSRRCTVPEACIQAILLAKAQNDAWRHLLVESVWAEERFLGDATHESRDVAMRWIWSTGPPTVVSPAATLPGSCATRRNPMRRHTVYSSPSCPCLEPDSSAQCDGRHDGSCHCYRCSSPLPSRSYQQLMQNSSPEIWRQQVPVEVVGTPSTQRGAEDCSTRLHVTSRIPKTNSTGCLSQFELFTNPPPSPWLCAATHLARPLQLTTHLSEYGSMPLASTYTTVRLYRHSPWSRRTALSLTSRRDSARNSHEMANTRCRGNSQTDQDDTLPSI